MTPDINEELTRWLAIATRSLPPETAQMVRSEIEAHYADAVSEHQALGKTAAEAHQAAMADLGDVKATARALRDIHLAKRRYITAAAVSLVIPFIFLSLPTLYKISGSEALVSIILRVSLLVSTLYVLSSLKVLLRLDSHPVDRPISIVIWSTIAADGARLLFWALFNQPAITETAERSLWDAAPFLARALDLVALGGEFAVGLGLILLGLRLVQVKDPLHGLRVPLHTLLLVMGCADVGFITAITLEAYLAAELLGAFGFLTIVLAFALMTLVFFRAAYRVSAPPTQTV